MSAVRLAYPIPASVRVFKSGSTYVAQTIEGKILSTSTTDASVVINAAIAGIPGAATRGYGGKVFIHAGDYDCKTQITADQSVLGYNAIELEGEGKGTRLNFTPSSALTNGILIKNARSRLAHMAIYGNSNVTNLVRVNGPDTTTRSDAGIVEAVEFRGANTTAGIDYQGAPVAGQIGLFRDGTLSPISAHFYWRIDKCDFRSLDIGAYARHELATSSHYSNINIYMCTTGIKLSAGENQLTNIYGTGGAYGRFLIHLANDGGANVGTNNNITNATGELYVPGQECATVLIDVGCSNNRLRNVTANVGGPPFDASSHFRVIDRNVTPINIDYDVNFIPMPSQSIIAMGWWRPAHTALGKEEGILSGNVALGGTALTYIASENGPVAEVKTASAVNSVTSLRYNNPNGNNIEARLVPSLNVRFHGIFPATEMRVFIGLWNGMAAAPTTSSDILNAKKGVGLWVDTAVTSQWKVMHNDGTGASTKTAIAGNPVLDWSVVGRASVYLFKHTANPFAAPPTATVKANVMINNIRTVVSTDLPPLDTDALGFLISVENLTAGAKGIYVYDIESSIFRSAY